MDICPNLVNTEEVIAASGAIVCPRGSQLGIDAPLVFSLFSPFRSFLSPFFLLFHFVFFPSVAGTAQPSAIFQDSPCLCDCWVPSAVSWLAL